jgi:predicted AlkP superfamily pyrophosphatase or phosphodiesterase
MVRFSHDPDHKDRGAEKLYHNGTDYFASTVVLISLDGFRPDYLNRGVTPHLRRFGNTLIFCILH